MTADLMHALTELWPLAALMVATGLVGGVLAGLLGVGGGIVVVPVLEIALSILGVDPAIRMHVAVATSLATIVPTSISSTRAHHRRGAVDVELVKHWAGLVFLGALLGTLIAANVKSDVLAAVFAVVALLVAIKMMLPLENITLAPAVPTGPLAAPLPLSIGILSAMMGIGGGTLSVPVMTLLNHPIHRAVGTAALFGLVISLPATAGYMISGYGDPRLPAGSIGFVNVVGFFLIAPATWLTAPLGARIAHGLSRRHLSLAFGVFLFIVACRMFYRAL
jgi:uncharacterized membrane protein YfcA